jgi:hypothetical protein
MKIGLRSAVIVAAIVLSAPFAAGCGKSAPPKPGQAEFEAASESIGVFSKEVGFGNTPAAIDVAKRFSVAVKKDVAESFTGGKDDAKDFVTHGNFLTYCEFHGNDVVLLVQAPNLDEYAGDVRKGLFDVAWESAQATLGNAATGRNLVIALRGKLLYGVIGKGKASGDAPKPQMDTALDTAQLYSYFTAAPPAASAPPQPPVAAAPSPQAPAAAAPHPAAPSVASARPAAATAPSAHHNTK